MTDINKMQNPLHDGNELVAANKETCSPKISRKRKGSENNTPIKRKKVKIKIDGAEPCCSATTVENVLDDMEEEIDSALKQPCFKDKLTPTNVKSILRHIIANEYVLTMVRDTMKQPAEGGGEESGDIAFEPKLTRSKAKEMRKQQCSLPWPVASPAKTVQKGSKKLLEEEFPDESSGDEDYKPEEECHSEDERASKASEAGTPRSKRWSVPSSPVSKATEPVSEDENALVIALPELEIPLDPSEADKIALRTRSKLCLNDTPLETIEASFIAPDFTLDMYDTRCDDEDWTSFLSELVKPIDTSGTNDHPDDANDPEYKAVEDEIPDYEDLRYERITTDEWNDLMLGTYEIAQADLSFLDDEEDEGEGEPIVEVGFVENAPPVIWMTSDQRLQLDEQMRMYVQMLTQSHLLSHGNSALEPLNNSTKIFLEEMKMFATRERESEDRSCFYAQNLDGALDIVKTFEDIKLPDDLANKKQTAKHYPPVPNHIQKTLATSKVFIYPELLPTCGLRHIIEKGKYFSVSEDNLIALGLEQFEGVTDPVEYIHKYLIPYKSVHQIRNRIKNCRFKDPDTHSIKYYLKFKQAPKFKKVIRIFDPDNIKSPKDYAPNCLPKWMESFCEFSTSEPAIPITSSAPQETNSARHPAKLPPFRGTLKPKKYTPILPQGTLKPKKYTPILPRGLFFPVPQYMNPFLKKYSKRRRRAPSICDSESPYIPPALKSKKKLSKSGSRCDRNKAAKLPNKLRPLRPKPRLSESNPECSDKEITAETPICNSESPYKSTPLKSKRRLSNSNSEGLDSKKTTKSPHKLQTLRSKQTISDYNPESSDIKKTTKTSVCDSESARKVQPLKPKNRLSDSSPECSDNEKTTEASICNLDSNNKPSTLKPKLKLSNSIEESSNSRKSMPTLIVASDTNVLYEVAAPVKRIDCSERRRKKYAAQQAVWAYLASCESFSGSKGKAGKTKVCDESDNEPCGLEEDSVAIDVSTKGKRQRAKQKRKSAAGSESTKGKNVKTKIEVDEDDEEELEASVIQTVSEIGKGQCSKRKSSDGTKSTNLKTATTSCDELKEETSDDEVEFSVSIAQTVSTRGKRQSVKKKNVFSARTKSSEQEIVTTKTCDKVDVDTCDNEEESAASVATRKEIRSSIKNGKSSPGAKSSKRKTVTKNICEEVEAETSDNEKESASVGTREKNRCSKKDGQTSPGAKSSKRKTATKKICEEVDDETSDDEEESAASVTTRKKLQCAKNKPNQSPRNLETSLACLTPMKKEQEVMFANSYLLRATEILKDDADVYEKFLSTLCKYHASAGSPVELYSELKEVLTDYPSLVRDFIVFLRPEQAKECGKYKDHIALSKVREFFKKLEVHFEDQPERTSQILRTFAQLGKKDTSADVISALRPLLNDEPHLFKELNDILS